MQLYWTEVVGFPEMYLCPPLGGPRSVAVVVNQNLFRDVLLATYHWKAALHVV